MDKQSLTLALFPDIILGFHISLSIIIVQMNALSRMITMSCFGGELMCIFLYV